MKSPPDAAMVEKVERRSAFLVATLASFLTPFMSSSVTVALPGIGADLGMDAVMLGWVATSFLLAAVVLLIPFGRLADMVGRKKIFACGIALYSASSAACGLATDAHFLIIGRACQGAGGAMIFGTGMAILASVYPASERGRVLGYNVAATYLGLSLGPFLGGLLTQYLGWRSVFLLNVPLGAAILVVTLWWLKREWKGAPGEGFDFMGAFLYGVALVALMYGLSLLPAHSGALIGLGGVAVLVLFSWWERRMSNPLFDVRLFTSNTVFALSNLAALINYSATFAVTFLLSLYLQYIKGLDPRGAGVILVAQPVMMAVLSPVAGKLSDRVEPRILASIGMGLSALGLGVLSMIRQDTPLSFILVCLVVLGTGFALFSSPNTNAVMSSVEKKLYGIASATLGTMRLTGQMLSMGIAMLLIALHVGRVQMTVAAHPQFLESARQAFLVFAVLCGAGVMASLKRGDVR